MLDLWSVFDGDESKCAYIFDGYSVEDIVGHVDRYLFFFGGCQL
jgi:hypothetical protein